MRVAVITPDQRETVSQLVFSHMSASDRERFMTVNPMAHKLISDVVGGRRGVGFVAQDRGTVVGYLLGGDKVNNLSSVKYAELYEMRVTSEQQSHGVGTLLVEQFLVWAKNQGYERVSVDAHSNSQKNIAFYEKLGFTPQTLQLEQLL